MSGRERFENETEGESRQRARRPADPGENAPEEPLLEDIQQLVHELQSRGAELETQNDELRAAQRELESSRDRYASLYDFAPLGYVTVDSRGRIREANIAAAAMLGVPHEELIGLSLADYVASPDKNVLWKHLRECRESEIPVAAELGLLPRGGEAMAVEFHSISVPDPDGEARLCRIAVTDITRRKEVEHELQALNESLESRVRQRTEELEQRAALSRKLASQMCQIRRKERRRLAVMLHHHHQQILYAVRVRLDMLRELVSRSELEQDFDEIEELLGEAIDSCRSLAQQLSPPILYEVGLSAAMEWLAEQTEAKHHLRVTAVTDPQANPEDEDTAELIFQAVRELVFNVVKHARAETARVVLARADGGYTEVTVADDGAGFDPEALETSAGSPTGLGLLGLRDRLEVIGGEMHLSAAPGQGTRVTLRVPRKPQAE